MTEGISFHVCDRIATIRIQNPPLNVLTLHIREELVRCARELSSNRSVRVVIIEGTGSKAFSAGSDIKEFPEDATGGVSKIRFEQFMLDQLQQIPQVTIAKLQGHVLGGGAALMLVCDLRVAAIGTAIGFPEIKLGAFPAGGGTHLLVREIGPTRAKELVFLGDPIDAEEARRIGLLNRVVPSEQLDETVTSLAERLSELSAEALAGAKRALNEGLRGEFERGQTVEVEGFAHLFSKENLRNGLTAFLQKRKPKFE